MLVPTRFKLPATELAGALALAGIAPQPGSVLPTPVPREQVQRELQARGVLDDSGGIVLAATTGQPGSPYNQYRVLDDMMATMRFTS